MLTSCSDEMVQSSGFLNGNEKTPIIVETNISANNPVTRAIDGKFEQNDVLLAYIQHVTTTGTDPLVYQADVEGIAPRLASFKVDALTSEHQDVADNFTNHSATSVLTVTDAEGLYWDDFSNSASEATDLRTANHALRVKYGYCYNGSSAYGENGSSISTELNPADGTLGWQVATDQSSGFRTSDLLFAPSQTPVAYTHGTNNTINGRDRVLTIPYTHAMSKVTVVVKCEDGFSSTKDNFANAQVKLQGMNTVATVTGPVTSVAPIAGDNNVHVKEIITQPLTAGKTNLQKSFSCLIVPTVMKADKLLAKIENVDGNNYEVKLTDALLNTSETNDWASQLAAHDANSVTPNAAEAYTEAEGGCTKPGVHYMMTVTIKKQQIQVQASIQDWDMVSAEGVGIVQFSNDVKTIVGTSGSTFNSDFDAYTQTGSANYAKASEVSWDEENSHWAYTPVIYWPNANDKFCFRALSPAGSTTTLTSGTEVLWGTTAEHKGVEADGTTQHDYAEGAEISPRTGDVPLVFYHPMSKISIHLKNRFTDADVPEGVTATNYDDPRNPLLNLAGAKIQVSAMKTSGTIALGDGTITPTGDAGNLFSGDIYAANDDDATTPQVEHHVVIPQTIPDDAIVTITLANGTTYKLQLNKCQYETGKDEEDNPTYGDLAAWQRGKHYSYTITLSKEAVTFRALIKEWEQTTSSGNATLEWD